MEFYSLYQRSRRDYPEKRYVLSPIPCAYASFFNLATEAEILEKFTDNLQPLPPPKAQTTWEKFAAKKGIKSKTAEQRKKMVYDEATGEWVPKWGYKGANKAGENDWIVEVDEKKERERKEGTERQGDGRRARVERVKRGERLQRKNERKERIKGPK